MTLLRLSDWPIRWPIRLIGAVVGLGISGVVVLVLALAGWRVIVTDANTFIPLLTVPITALLGAQYAPAVARASKFDPRRVTLFTVEAVLLAQAIFALLWASVFSPAGLLGHPLDALSSAIFLFALALVFAALPFFMLSWPFVALWAIVLRKLVPPLPADRRDRALAAPPIADGAN